MSNHLYGLELAEAETEQKKQVFFNNLRLSECKTEVVEHL